MAELYEDLLKDTSESFEDGNYFLLTITELELGTTYPLEFRWKYKDGTYGKDWSAVYNITTPVSSVPGDPALAAGDVVGGPGYIKVTWNGNDASGNPIENIDRVNVHIAGASFGDGTKPAGFFKTAGTQTFAAEPGIYIVQLKAVRVDGATSFFSTARTVTVTAIEEAIETPVVPNGFTARAILSGIEVSWAGTYVGGAAWSGFQAINIYAGTSSSATGGTYIKVGQMTANKVSNKIVIPIDGTYVRYGFPAYIHASSVNKATPPVESSISANVASATPSQVVNTDLINEAITATKIALGAVTNTKIADDAITTPKILAGAITTGKIDTLAITSDKIAALAITAGKIDTNAITADLINSGTLKATTYIRVGTKNLSTGAGGRIEISSALIEDGTYDIPAGLYIYDSAGNAVLSAPLGGGLSITGSGTFTGNLLVGTGDSTFGSDSNGIWLGRSTFAAASDKFRVSRSGVMNASSGTIGGIIIAADAIQNGATSGASTFRLDSSGKARFGASNGNSIILDPTIGIFQSTDGTNANGNFTLNATGSSTISGWTIGSSSISKGTTILSSSGTNGLIQIGSSTSFFKASSDGLQLGNETFGSAPFRVTPAGALTATSATITGTINASGGSIGGWSVDSNGYLTNNSDTWLHPSTGYTTGGYSSTNFSIISSRGISGSTIQATSSSATSIQTSGGITLSGNISSTGDITTSGGIFVTGTGVITSNGLITAINGVNISFGGLNVLSGGATFGTTPGQVMEYLNSNGNLRIGSNTTRLQADGQIFANTLGVAAGTTLVQSSTGFIKVSSSSRRYKENIVEIDKFGYLNTITQLKPVTFNYKQEVSPDDYQILVSGLIAEDVDEIESLRTVVNYNPEGLPESVSYDRLSALIVLAIKEIKDKLEIIETRLDALEG